MNRIAIGPEGCFSFGGENFVLSVAVKDRPPSTSEAFTIAKNEHYIRVYEELASAFSPRSILELGIFQGGSYVLLDKLLNPRRMSAVDISEHSVAPLLQYVAAKEGRFVHFSTSQSDRKILEHIVRSELADELDLVVDDASHTYEQTKASFEILFALLRPGGIYLIEDWNWAHHPYYQAPDAPLAKDHALSNLLFEQLMLMGSTWSISEIRVWKFLYLIRKSKRPLPAPDMGQDGEDGSVFDQIVSRGRKWNLI
jgi:predicted O-methyltransferase YrrM